MYKNIKYTDEKIIQKHKLKNLIVFYCTRPYNIIVYLFMIYNVPKRL